MLHPVQSEKTSNLNIQAAHDGGKIGFRVKLHGIDPVQVGLAVVRGQLAVPETARQRVSVIGTDPQKKPHALVEYGEGICFGRLHEMATLMTGASLTDAETSQ